MTATQNLTQLIDQNCFTARPWPAELPQLSEVNPRKIGIFGKRASDSGRHKPIDTLSGLVFQGSEGNIRPTHSPCPSRYAVTHIKGEFFSCAPPNSPVEERT